MNRWLLLLLLLPAVASADATVTVGPTGDYATIGEAVAATAAGSGPDCIDVIQVSAGTYAEDVDLAGLDVVLQGDPDGGTIIAGSGAGPVVTIGPHVGPGGPTLRDLTIRGAAPTGPVNWRGGCVSVTDADPLLIGLLLEDCTALEGGCVAFEDSRGRLDQSRIHGCTAVQAPTTSNLNILPGRGGCVLVRGGNVELSEVRLWSCSAEGVGGGVTFDAADGSLANAWISDSDAQWGGALGVVGAEVQVSDSSFTDNQACDGGGALSVYQDGVAELRGVALLDNEVVGQFGGQCVGTPTGGGGAIWMHTRADLSLEDSFIAGNVSARGGGAAWVSHSSELSLERTLLRSNSATGRGGAILGDVLSGEDSPPTLDIEACLLEENEAGNDGGAIAGALDSGLVVGAVFRDNEAGGDGGGLRLVGLGGALDVHHSLFWENEAGRGSQVAIDGALDLFASTLVGGRCTSGGVNPASLQLTRTQSALEMSLYNLVVGDVDCDWALAVDTALQVPPDDLEVGQSLIASGHQGTQGPMFVGATVTQPVWAQEGDGPVFSSASPTSWRDFALEVQDGDRDGVDDGRNLGLDPDGSPTDMGAFGGEDAAIWGTGDADGDGISVWDGDCHEGRRLSGPGQAEECNCLDDDCDGVVDEDAGCDPLGVCVAPLPEFPGDDDDSAGDDDDSAETPPPAGCIVRCDAGGAGGGSWLLVLPLLALLRRRVRAA